MFSGALDYLGSLFGLSDDKKQDEENGVMHLRSRPAEPPRPTAQSTEAGNSADRFKQRPKELDVKHLNETSFIQNDDIDRNKEQLIRDFLGDVLSIKETGYASGSDSFEDIDPSDWDGQDTSPLTSGKYDGHVMNISAEVHTTANEFNDVSSRKPEKQETDVSEVKLDIEPVKTHGKSGVTDEEQPTGIATVSAVASLLRRSVSRKGATNYGFDLDAEDETHAEPKEAKSNTGLTKVTARTRWDMIRDKHVRRAPTTSILVTNPTIAAQLTQSYKRAQKRVGSYHPSWIEVIQKVHLAKFGHKIKCLLDSNVHMTDHSAKTKYYEESDSSSEYNWEGERDYYKNPKKKRWWQKKARTTNEKLKKYKFFGKAVAFMSDIVTAIYNHDNIP